MAIAEKSNSDGKQRIFSEEEELEIRKTFMRYIKGFVPLDTPPDLILNTQYQIADELYELFVVLFNRFK